MIEQSILSIGAYACEAESVDALDYHLEQSPLFNRIEREVCGYVVQPRIGTNAGKTVRIDRILMPSKKLIAAGWEHGPVGVEAKTSKKRLGRVVSQALDYHASVFEIHKGYHIMLEWIFLWPFQATKVKGDIASVMTQNRIGCVHRDDYSITFGNDSGYMLQWTGDTIQVRNEKAGRKRGSR